MKGSATIDYDAKTVRIDLTLEALEEGGPAIDAIKGACRMLWPDIFFSGVDDPPEDGDAPAEARGGGVEAALKTPAAAPSAPKPPRKRNDFSRPPQPGSPTAQVLDAALRLKSTDATVIADALDLRTGIAAMRLGMLRKGGHLAGLE